MAKKAAKKEGSDSLVVKSKMKEYIKGKGCNSAGNLGEGLTNIIKEILDKAIARAKANGRKTVQEKDL